MPEFSQLVDFGFANIPVARWWPLRFQRSCSLSHSSTLPLACCIRCRSQRASALRCAPWRTVQTQAAACVRRRTLLAFLLAHALRTDSFQARSGHVTACAHGASLVRMVQPLPSGGVAPGRTLTAAGCTSLSQIFCRSSVCVLCVIFQRMPPPTGVARASDCPSPFSARYRCCAERWSSHFSPYLRCAVRWVFALSGSDGTHGAFKQRYFSRVLLAPQNAALLCCLGIIHRKESLLSLSSFDRPSAPAPCSIPLGTRTPYLSSFAPLPLLTHGFPRLVRSASITLWAWVD